MEPNRHVVLVGLMGSGKTPIGTRLAARLGCRFVDNDEELMRRTGQTAREIANEHGIERLHAEEAATFLEALASSPPAVVAGAASTIESAAVRGALRDEIVVWLDVDVADLARRLRAKTYRPYGDRDSGELVAELSARRAPLFRDVATFVVRPGGRTDGSVADEIAELVQ